jgi:hypothetical protein
MAALDLAAKFPHQGFSRDVLGHASLFVYLQFYCEYTTDMYIDTGGLTESTFTRA